MPQWLAKPVIFMVFRLLQNAFVSLKIEITHFYSSSHTHPRFLSLPEMQTRITHSPRQILSENMSPPSPPPSPGRGEGEETMKLILSIVKE